MKPEKSTRYKIFHLNMQQESKMFYEIRVPLAITIDPFDERRTIRWSQIARVMLPTDLSRHICPWDSRSHTLDIDFVNVWHHPYRNNRISTWYHSHAARLISRVFAKNIISIIDQRQWVMKKRNICIHKLAAQCSYIRFS